ncbi:cadherin-23-like [Armigeres subalbatus]|uniref:cadherin-23-like n=1 Tax=Armigeres subalbatus TaxID=124917 RepID=UPI002ED59B70
MDWKRSKILISLILLSFLCRCPATPAGEWTLPYLTSLEPEKVVIGEYLDDVREQTITVWEEMDTPIRIAKINYKGNNLTVGNKPTHLALIQDTDWYLEITSRMDYEQESHRLSSITLVIEGNVLNTFTVVSNLVNILDNAPSMYSEGNCRIPEYEEDFLSDCQFTVHHADGFNQNDIEGKYTNELKFEISEFNDTFEMEQTIVQGEFNQLFNLSVIQGLNYADRAVYTFSITVHDLHRTHNFTLSTVVQVQNVESRVPIFTHPFTTQRITEKTSFNTTVTAIDGDTGINAPICYELETEVPEYAEYFSIMLDEDAKHGILQVKPIDRDVEKNEYYQFKIMAYKCHNQMYNITSEAAIILDDLNDNAPTFNVTPHSLEFWENTLMELPFDYFYIEDIDLDRHATYSVYLEEDISGTIHSDPDSFSIIPRSGYQLASFILTIVNTKQLDFELPERRQFDLIITAVEAANASHTNQQSIAIKLRNWNDEMPEFDKEIYEISINETIAENEEMLTVTITDRDVDDEVKLRIMSLIGEDMAVDPVTIPDQDYEVPTFVFRISTKKNDTFDYDVAHEVILQLEATDTLQTEKNESLHQTFAQVVIKVLDINNKPPSITVPRERIHIFENSEPGTVVLIESTGEEAILIGTDTDTDAQLQFSIDWATSYAVKGGSSVKPEIFKECLIIDQDSTDRNRVTGKIIVNPELDQQTINQRLDYEEYDTLFITVRLVDENQVVPPGDTESLVVIQIGNVNDNEPQFVGNTLTVERNVLEEASNGTIVGSVEAIDRDGDEIIFSISAKSPNHEGLITIASNGMLTVNASEEKYIDCDVPITYAIALEITLSDGLHVTNGSLEILITDTNNKSPTFSESIPAVVEIFEKSQSGTEILQLNVQDLDRDSPHNLVSFEIDFKTFPELRNFFEVTIEEDDSGERLNQTAVVLVKENNYELDRDTGTDRFTINVKAQDNPGNTGRRNSDEASFTLILLDINDQEPKMPVLASLRLTEDAQEGAILVERFEATDLDDRTTPNAKINYRLMDIKAAGDNSPEAAAQDTTSEPLFTLTSLDEFATRLSVGRALKTFYGSWSVQIEACDRGDEYDRLEDSPRLCSNSTYTVQVDPVNYMAPKIEFPGDDERIRIKFESLTNGQPLVDTQGNTVKNFWATDTDGGNFGVVTFSLQSQDDSSQDHVFFQLTVIDKHTVRLELANAEAIQARSYRVILHAVDGGGRSATPVNIVIAFINMTGEPEFQDEDSPFHTDFTENEEGMEEERTIPEAIDPKNAELPEGEHSNVFYFIDLTYGNASHLFQLDKETRILRLTQELDREEIPSHEIRVIATNNVNGPTATLTADSRSQLIVYIKVNDVNDNPPKFQQLSYSAGITANDYSGKILFEVFADDPDEDDVISYSIDETTLETHGTNLPTSPFPFAMNKENGQLSLSVQIQDNMKGHFTFTIVAKDLVDHNDTVPVKIYIIAESNRVKFVFLNNVDDINTAEMREFLKTEFTTYYEMECNIDDVVQGTIDATTKSGDLVTDVRAHFIQNDEAVEAVVIQQRSNDRVFVTNLKTALSARQLFLQDVPVTSVTEAEENSELLQTILIVVAAALAILCIILLVAFCIKIRSLNRQLKAMSATDFVSIASDMNIGGGGGRKVPTTNVFSVEGSNPVLNNREYTKGAYDDVSVQSYESDFIGIDNDLFANSKQKDDGLNPALMEHIRQRSLNPLVHGGSGADIGDSIKLEPEPPARPKTDNNDELIHRF